MKNGKISSNDSYTKIIIFITVICLGILVSKFGGESSYSRGDGLLMYMPDGVKEFFNRRIL